MKMKYLFSYLLLALPALAGGCPYQVVQGTEVLDFNCRLFRIVRTSDIVWIERLNKQRKVLSRERLDCTKATRDQSGIRYVYPKTVSAPIWCPNYPLMEAKK
jgi:hypothetical protein